MQNTSDHELAESSDLIRRAETQMEARIERPDKHSQKHNRNLNLNHNHARARRRLDSSFPRRHICTVLVLINVMSTGRVCVRAQCPINTMTTFERVGGVTLKDTPMTLLYSVSNSTLNSMMGFRETVARLPGVPITAECNNRCRKSVRCRAFLVDYARQLCYSIEQPPASASSSMQAAGSGQAQASQVMLAGGQERTAYFEKHCFNLASLDCERAWIFERVLGHQLKGNDAKIIEGVPSRIRCQEHCMNEREFKCRSGEFDYEAHQCRLSAIDRHSQPGLFKPAPGLSVDYFENQCVNLGQQCEAFDKFENMDLGRAEILRSANSSEQCQQMCTQLIKAFICRSFTWNPMSGKCYLNSANTFTAGGTDRLLPAPGLTYFQRNDCFDLQLECDHTAMTLNLRTNEPFRGRMYVRDDPLACETTGRSTLSSSLQIPFQSQARCAQRELVNRFSSVVVVQHHPLIQRRSDRYVKLVCDFQTANKTVTSTYNVVANPWTSTALINATSIAPKIRLRITDRFNNDVVGAKLGDELFLNIEAETDSIYDMVARSVMAKSGGSESESIMLIDKDGCPTDARIFPSLKKLNRRTIRGKFDAFKFSTDVVVRFQVDVQFCLNQCPATVCDSPAASLLAASLSPNKADFTSGLDTYSAGSLSTQSLSSSSPASELALSTLGALLNTPSPLEHYSTRPLPANGSSLASRPTNYLGSGSEGAGSASDSSLANNNYMQQADHVKQSSANLRPHQLLSYPANQPANFSQDALAEAQNFEARSNNYLGNGQENSLAIASTGSNQLINAAGQHANSANSRRRRRSAEPVPAVPAHVPLQGEIIIRERDDSVQSSSRRPKSQQPQATSASYQQQSGSRKSPTTTSSKSQQASSRQRSAWRDQSGPAYELNNGPPNQASSEDQHQEEMLVSGIAAQEQTNEASLLCTNRQSLIVAMLAFCAIQFLTIALCLITWLYRNKEASNAKLGLMSQCSSPFSATIPQKQQQTCSIYNRGTNLAGNQQQRQSHMQPADDLLQYTAGANKFRSLTFAASPHLANSSQRFC